MCATFPCIPPLLGSMTPYCRNGMPLPPQIRVCILIWEFCIFLNSFVAAAFYMDLILFPGIACVWKYLKVLTPQFSKETFKLYRKLQIVEILHNVCSRRRILPTLLVVGPFLEVFCIYVCIKLHDDIDMPEFAMFPLLLLDIFIVLVLFPNLASKVWRDSKKFMMRWKWGYKGKLMRRKMKTVKPLKIWCGNNFVDEGTPLVIQDFCLRTTVSLLLLSGNRTLLDEFCQPHFVKFI